MSNETLVRALVKLRHRIDGHDVTISQAEAQALYLAVVWPERDESAGRS